MSRAALRSTDGAPPERVSRRRSPRQKTIRELAVMLEEGVAQAFETKAVAAPTPAVDEPVYVTRPYLPPFEEFEPLLRRIWETRVLSNGGPYHKELEARLRDHLGVPQVALLNNATSALIMALRALDLSGEVITTPYSFVATSHALLWSGLTPVFADIDPQTLNLDPAAIEAAITPRTTAILPVHCYGRPCDIEAIEAIARRHGLKVIYDAAHAFGVSYRGRSVLSYGDLSVLSFHATKVFNTFEGGAIVCHDAAMKDRIEKLKNFGFESETSVIDVGLNGKMSEFNAALGLLQLRHIDAAIDQRRVIDARYRRELAGIPGIRCLAPADDCATNYSYFPILIDPEYPIDRNALYEVLKADGLHARRYFHPLISDFPMYSGLPSASRENLPVAASAADRILCLPIYPDLEERALARIIGRIRCP
ncbi:DegT/DnrJ/EryC1/StrS family aminotransferase [Methylobacterium sp. C25]|uniref:DegT/DnrJ/EryC1/StrS family aminotransferase n=1 Tax=Methylobacterium sp. C25 TaxID=2721622 RepID=UPI001F484151|nr:DegT/DnrJ/EryC1/StrS family aminotransferase [Methylobacterium sp. C25]